jgi:hypothetical protein
MSRFAQATEDERQIVRLKEEAQALQRQVNSLTQAANQAKVEAAKREPSSGRESSCEEFFNEWEVRGAPASISTIAALAREAAAAKDCIEKGEVTSACKHWQGLLSKSKK